MENEPPDLSQKLQVLWGCKAKGLLAKVMSLI